MITNKNNRNRKNILFTVQFAILLALEAIFCFVPILGSIPFTPVIVATTAMLPVIITALLLGAAAGTLMGFFAGIFSLIVWTFTPPNPVIAFLFTPFYSLGEVQGNGFSLAICIVPRILIGLFAGFVFNALKGIMSKNKASETIMYAICGIAGSLANTIFVLAGWYFFFAEDIARVFQWELSAVFNGAIVLTFLTNGVPELIISAVVAVFVCMPLKYILKKQNLL